MTYLRQASLQSISNYIVIFGITNSQVSKIDKQVLFMTPEKEVELKKQSALKAVEFIRDGQIVGLGSGSTVQFALDEIARKINTGELKNITGIPTSLHTEKRAKELGIPLTTLDENPEIDLTIDGADNVDDDLNLIKGGGGCHLHEKIIAQATKELIIIVDERKISPKLGEKFYVPVEVIQKALRTETIYIESLGAKVEQRFFENGEPYITDENNYILMCDFGAIEKPEELSRKLNARAGIAEHGLFIGMTSKVVVAGEDGIVIKER